MNIALNTNKEFKSLIPPLTAEEYSQLQENLINDGIREPISVWNNTIIDGHNRYEIAKSYGLGYETKTHHFDNESDAMLWIIKNQFGRRNLKAYDRSKLALKMKPLIAEKAKGKQILGGEDKVCQKSDKPIDTKKEIAKIAGVSHDTITKVEKIESAAVAEIIKLVKNDEISINQAEKAARLNSECQKEIAPFLEAGETVEKITSKLRISHNTGNN